MMSGRSAIRAPTAYERMSPRRWIMRLSGSWRTGSRRRAESAGHPVRRSARSRGSNAATTCEIEVRGRIMSLPPPLNDRCVGFSASAGSSCSSTIGQASFPRIAMFAYSTGARRGVRPALATRSAHPRTRPSGRSSPTPSKESPIATYRTDATPPAYGPSQRSSRARPRRSKQSPRGAGGDREERREDDEQKWSTTGREQQRNRQGGHDRGEASDSRRPPRSRSRAARWGTSRE